MGTPVFEVYNADGSLQMNLASRLTKYLGSVRVGTSAGSLTDPGLAQGTPWYLFAGEAQTRLRMWPLPEITFANQTMYWTASAPEEQMVVLYGVYSNGSN